MQFFFLHIYYKWQNNICVKGHVLLCVAEKLGVSKLVLVNVGLIAGEGRTEVIGDFIK